MHVLVKFEFFWQKNVLYGVAGTVAAHTNRFVGAAGNISRLYKSICKAGLGTVPTNA